MKLENNKVIDFKLNFCIAGNILLSQAITLVSSTLNMVSKDIIDETISLNVGMAEMSENEALNELIYHFGLYDSFIAVRDGIDTVLKRFDMIINEIDDSCFNNIHFIPSLSHEYPLLEIFKQFSVQTNLALTYVTEYNKKTGQYTDEYVIVLGIILTELRAIITKLEKTIYIPF